MTPDASEEGAICRVEEEHSVESREDYRPDGSEKEEASTVAFASVKVVVVGVEARSEPGRDSQLLVVVIGV